MNCHKPKVTVLLPVYNCEKYLSEAIESILQQTFTDFELLIIYNKSKDGSLQIIEEYNDPRIRLVHQDKQRPGFAAALNIGLELAKGQYIARMDCDDISLPERLRKQVEFMDNHPEIGICGTWTELFGEDSGIVQQPITSDEIKVKLFLSSSLSHPTVMFRKAKLREHNLSYNTEFKIGEDYDLWNRSIELFPLANLPEVLLKYRVQPYSLYRSNLNKYLEHLQKIHTKNLAALNITYEEEHFPVHRVLITPSIIEGGDRKLLEKTNIWIQKIHKGNLERKVYIEPHFSEVLANKWFWACFWLCFRSKSLGLLTWKTFWESPFSKYNTISWKNKAIFAVISIIFQWKFLSALFSCFYRVIRKNQS